MFYIAGFKEDASILGRIFHPGEFVGAYEHDFYGIEDKVIILHAFPGNPIYLTPSYLLSQASVAIREAYRMPDAAGVAYLLAVWPAHRGPSGETEAYRLSNEDAANLPSRWCWLPRDDAGNRIVPGWIAEILDNSLPVEVIGTYRGDQIVR